MIQSLTRTERFQTILACASFLDRLSQHQVRLAFDIFEIADTPLIPERDQISGTDRFLEVLKGLPDDILLELHATIDDRSLKAWNWKTESDSLPLTIFLSHPDKKGKELAHNLEDDLESYGVEALVASHNVTPGDDWWRVIASMLDSCHLLVGLGIQGFSGRPFCQQEVGWVLARRCPVLWLTYSDEGKSEGMASRFQALQVPEERSTQATALQIIGWCGQRPELLPPLARALLNRLREAEHFADTDAVVTALKTLPSLPKEIAFEMLAVAKTNDQVGGAHVPEYDYQWPRERQPTFSQWVERRFLTEDTRR